VKLFWTASFGILISAAFLDTASITITVPISVRAFLCEDDEEDLSRRYDLCESVFDRLLLSDERSDFSPLFCILVVFGAGA
jgi:hypothetical protein